MAKQRRAGQEQRALLGKKGRRDRIGRTGRVAIADHHPARAKASSDFTNVSLPTGVVNDEELCPIGDPARPQRRNPAGVDDRMVAAMGARHRCFLVGGHRPDHRCAERIRPLAEDQADAARRSVNEDRFAQASPRRPRSSIRAVVTLEHHGGGKFVRDIVGQLDQAIRVDQPGSA